MRPPICDICHEDILEGEHLIYFQEDEADKAMRKRLSEPGMTGHPSNAFWFCEKHYQIAKEFSEMTKKDAFAEIRKVLDK